MTLTTNINPQWGLTNGVKGNIKDIVYQKGNRPNIDLPSFVVVHFPDFIGPQFFRQKDYNNYLPIAPISTSSDDFRFKRIQLPLRLRYTIPIHKSQEMETGIKITYCGFDFRRALFGPAN